MQPRAGAAGSPAPLDAHVAGDEQALPPAAHGVLVAAQAARAVLPLRLGQLELVQHQLDQDAVVLRRPLSVAILLVLDSKVWRRR